MEASAVKLLRRGGEGRGGAGGLDVRGCRRQGIWWCEVGVGGLQGFAPDWGGGTRASAGGRCRVFGLQVGDRLLVQLATWA